MFDFLKIWEKKYERKKIKINKLFVIYLIFKVKIK